MDKNEIYTILKKILIDRFEVQSGLIGPEKLLSDDLDIDSLDAVDLLLYLGSHVTGKLDPALFKNARTVQDLVDILHPIWRSSG